MYEDVLCRLQHVRPARRPRTWYASCPAHDDRRPSLMLWVGRTGCLCARCLARNCDFADIVRASGTAPGDWFPTPPQPMRRMTMRALEAVYDYTDEAGSLLFQVLRHAPAPGGRGKSFSQRRPDGKGGWLADLQGVRRVLYRLPEVLADSRQPVVIVEGEKDVESLRALGLVATTNPGGAGKWRPDYGTWLRQRRVAVLRDNDPPGLLHALHVVGSLVLAGVESLRLVHLGGPDGADVTDWLANLPTSLTTRQRRDALVGEIRRSPEWAPLAPAAPASPPPSETPL